MYEVRKGTVPPFGEFYTIPNDEKSKSIRGYALQLGRKTGKRFVTRVFEENGEKVVGIWRIE